MNEIQIFKHEKLGELRVAGTAENPMFCLSDVCKSLELGNPSQVKTRLDASGIELVDMSTLIPNEGVIINQLGNTMTNFINEPNLYRCIFRSDKKEAKAYQDWVFNEVLPTIRKTGGYMVTKQDDTPETIMARAIIIAQNTMRHQKEQINSLQAVVKRLAPDAEYAKKVLTAENTYLTNAIAKEFGMSAVTLNKHLQRLGIQYKQRGMWVLSYKYQDKGYTKTSTAQYFRSDGSVGTSMQTEWTEQGRKWLHELHDRKHAF